MEEQIRDYQDIIIGEYWNDDGMILEALKEAVSEDATYASLLSAWHKTANYDDIGRLTLFIIENYFSDKARQAAEEKVSWL